MAMNDECAWGVAGSLFVEWTFYCNMTRVANVSQHVHNDRTYSCFKLPQQGMQYMWDDGFPYCICALPPTVMSRFVFTALGQFEGCFFHFWLDLASSFFATHFQSRRWYRLSVQRCGHIFFTLYYIDTLLFGWKRVKLCAPPPTHGKKHNNCRTLQVAPRNFDS